jgi:hypothetical protein
MKRIIPIFLILLLLSGCKMRNYTPVINEDMKLSAIYKTGDFSFSCDIIRQGDVVSITPTSTRAKGLVISCNGKEVTFKRNKLKTTFDISELDKTNPAIIFYQVFSSLSDAEVKLIDGVFTYTGNCALGKYILKQTKRNELLSLEIPSADILITFQT